MKTLTHLKPQELSALPRDRTWVLLPIGGFENHGIHLPVGHDQLEAQVLAKKLGERLEQEAPDRQVLLYPTVPLSIDVESGGFPIRVRAHVLRDYLIDVVGDLYRQGFRYFAVISGNYGPRQLTVIEEASQLIARKHRKFPFFGRKNTAPCVLSLCSSDIEMEKRSRSLFWADFPEHGGKRDTSVALAFFPEQTTPAAELPEVSFPLSGWKKKRALTRGDFSGYWGRPADATPENGRALVEQKITQWLPLFNAAEKGVSALNLVSSRYSKNPVNYSLFWVWLMAFFLLFFFAGWVYLSVMTIFRGANFQ